MAARKEKPVLIASQPPSGRITRAQAAAARTQYGVAPSVPVPVKTDLKQTAKGKMKRGALDENCSANVLTSAPQPKRRTVLKDVTNISCAESSKYCTALTKLQSRPSQRIGRALSRNKQGAKEVPKPLPPTAGGNSLVNACNTAEEIKKADLLAEKKNPTVKVENDGAPSVHNVEQNRVSACHEVFFEERNARVKSKPAESEAGDSAGLDIIDIDKDNRNPQLCTSYVAEIYANLMASEVLTYAYIAPQLIRRPRSNYMEALQRDITRGMRGILIDWLIEVSEEYKLVPDTLYLTVNLIDRFLSLNYIERQKLQLLGITSMLIASKYEEVCAPGVEEFCHITDNTYTKAEVMKMERQVLNDLGFHLSVPTPKTFLRRFIRAAQASSRAPPITLMHLTNYLAELTLVDYTFLKCLPSVVAASALFLALWTLDQSDSPWNCTLEYYTSYKSSDIRTCVCALRELQHNTSNCPLNAIREKYRQQKYECVANLTSPELLQSLFI
ncbi:hypothetical protein ACP70R_048817 [Stipagrostis hirtigluma subsp. patula]